MREVVKRPWACATGASRLEEGKTRRSGCKILKWTGVAGMGVEHEPTYRPTAWPSKLEPGGSSVRWPGATGKSKAEKREKRRMIVSDSGKRAGRKKDWVAGRTPSHGRLVLTQTATVLDVFALFPAAGSCSMASQGQTRPKRRPPTEPASPAVNSQSNTDTLIWRCAWRALGQRRRSQLVLDGGGEEQKALANLSVASPPLNLLIFQPRAARQQKYTSLVTGQTNSRTRDGRRRGMRKTLHATVLLWKSSLPKARTTTVGVSMVSKDSP